MSLVAEEIAGIDSRQKYVPELSAAPRAPKTDSDGKYVLKLSAKLAAIEAERKRLRVTMAALSIAAGLNANFYTRIHKSPANVRRSSIAALRAGLRVLALKSRRRNLGEDDKALIISTFNSFLMALARANGMAIEDVRGELARTGVCSARATWRRASAIRQAAIYLTNTALGVPQFRLARALDLTAAAVCLAIRAVEDRRDDAAFDAVLTQTEILVTGRE
jgi:hypothetical protein